jgi:predicted DCC family thiol-disulfide oxidoreductase YuxK
MGLVLFFDGDCGFCSKSVRQVYRLDVKGSVEFSPLQGKLAKELGLEKFADKEGGTMVIIRESDGTRFFKGDAWIELGKTLGGIWAAMAACFSIFPKAARDWGYDLVARNRYLLAGKVDSCGMPDEGLRKRMRE